MNLGNLGMIFNSLKAVFGAEDASKEAKLTQQTTSLLSPRNDEAIELALDAALRVMINLPQSHYRGSQCVDALTKIRLRLKKHQRDDWRENYAAHELTEKFENIVTEEVIERFQANNNQQQQPQGNQQRRREPLETIRRKVERRARDYEYTREDPRIQHLIYVADKFLEANRKANDDTEDAGFKAAYNYLLGAGLIKEKSASEIAGDVLKAGQKVAQHEIRSIALGDQYNLTMKRANLTDEAKEAHLDQLMREKIDRQKKEVKDFRWRPAYWVIILVILLIIITEWGARSIGN